MIEAETKYFMQDSNCKNNRKCKKKKKICKEHCGMRELSVSSPRRGMLELIEDRKNWNAVRKEC